MAVPANTYSSYDVVGVQEQVDSLISNISPTDYPFTSGIGKDTAYNKYTQWQTEELEAPNLNNAQLEGDDADFDAAQPTVMLGAYQQILRKTLVVSETNEAIKKYGRGSEVGHQVAKKGEELRRDLESIYLNNQGSSAGAGGGSPSARRTAGVPAWIETNQRRGTGGAAGGFTANVANAATDGTTRALTEAELRGVIRDCYMEGGNPSTIMVHPEVKEKLSQYLFTDIARVAMPYRDQKGEGQATAVGAYDVFISDFGRLMIVPNRFQRSRDVHVLDMKMFKDCVLRGYSISKLDKTGDNTKRMIITERTLKSVNEKGSGIIADIDSTAAMTA